MSSYSAPMEPARVQPVLFDGAPANEAQWSSLSQRTLELEAINRELEAFSYTAAHDLKTPLNAVRGFIYLLNIRFSDTLPKEGLVLLQYIDQSAANMGALIEALLSLSKASGMEMQRRCLDLSGMAADVFGELAAREASSAELRVEPGLAAHADQGLMRSLLLNLLGNAQKFSAGVEHPVIEFGQRETDRGTAFFVCDNGSGFEVADPAQLFVPFHRFHRDDRFAGSGIGLATCRRIVLHHGGDIWLNTKPGVGTTVFFTLAAEEASRS